jgi:RimJ/RimL family protein N-acetyltransferase
MHASDFLREVKLRAGSQAGFVVPVGQPVRALLRPVGLERALQRADDVAVLTEWRNRHRSAFLTEFEANASRTSKWLEETVRGDSGRVLFMLDDLEGLTLGYMGLAYIDWENGKGEADAIVRGREAPAGLMSEALRTLLKWARHQLGLSHLGVRVRSDNPALTFYQKLGFRESHRQPLERLVEGDMVIYRENSQSDGAVSLVFMDWTGE